VGSSTTGKLFRREAVDTFRARHLPMFTVHRRFAGPIAVVVMLMAMVAATLCFAVLLGRI